MQFILPLLIGLLVLLVPGGVVGASAFYYIKNKRGQVVEDIKEDEDEVVVNYDPVFNRAPDDQGYQVNGTAWASWYKGDEPDSVHTSVWWKPSANKLSEPEHSIIKWTRKGGRVDSSPRSANELDKG